MVRAESDDALQLQEIGVVVAALGIVDEGVAQVVALYARQGVHRRGQCDAIVRLPGLAKGVP
ncbi:hypothetical protein D3C75_1291210 [compost metagenome]